MKEYIGDSVLREHHHDPNLYARGDQEGKDSSRKHASARVGRMGAGLPRVRPLRLLSVCWGCLQGSA